MNYDDMAPVTAASNNFVFVMIIISDRGEQQNA